MYIIFGNEALFINIYIYIYIYVVWRWPESRVIYVPGLWGQYIYIYIYIRFLMHR